jgi:hypothetical protein
MDAAVTHLKAAEMEIKKDDLERLSPVGQQGFQRSRPIPLQARPMPYYEASCDRGVIPKIVRRMG